MKKKKIMGSLYCLDKYNSLRLIDKNYITPNGPTFSRCKKYMFHNDTSKRIIYIFKKNKYNEFKKKKIFIKFKKKYGKPDGMMVDKFNNIWVGMFGGGSVLNIKIKNKKIIQQIFLPSLNITNCTIGGRNNDLLFVTSAMKKIKKEELKKNIFYGNSFIVKLISKSNHLSL
jgi:sugar lactone lactonase YvrE